MMSNLMKISEKYILIKIGIFDIFYVLSPEKAIANPEGSDGRLKMSAHLDDHQAGNLIRILL